MPPDQRPLAGTKLDVARQTNREATSFAKAVPGPAQLAHVGATLHLKKWSFCLLLEISLQSLQMPEGATRAGLLKHPSYLLSAISSFGEWQILLSKIAA